MSNRSTKIQLSSVCVLSLLLEIPRYFEYKVEELNGFGETVYVRWLLGLVEDDFYQQIFRSGLYPLIKRYIPLLITSILTYHLIKFLIKSNRLRRTVLSSCVHNGNERNITDIDYLEKVLTTIALVYIICLTPWSYLPHSQIVHRYWILRLGVQLLRDRGRYSGFDEFISELFHLLPEHSRFQDLPCGLNWQQLY